MASLISRLASSLARNSSTKLLSSSILKETQVVAPLRLLSCLSPDRATPILLEKSEPCFILKKSGFASLHTEGDRRFAELLQQEIEEEKGNMAEIPAMSDGWKLTMRESEGNLQRSQDGDNIEVSFNLNGSVPPVSEEGDEEPDIASYPDFTVQVTKSGESKAVEFECYFPDDVQEGMVEESMSLFSIRSVVMFEGSIEDQTYVIDTENLDPSVYSFFLTYLADRGVDSQFAQEFIQLCTAAEHQEYIRSLQKLKAFISNK